MKTYRTSISIHAEPAAIWAILTDAERYPEWNNTVERVEGTIAPGECIKVHAKISPGRAFPVKVSTFEPSARMVWSSGMPLGLFKGEQVEFTMQEVFSGPFSPMIERSIPDLQPAFDEFAADLKRRAEA